MVAVKQKQKKDDKCTETTDIDECNFCITTLQRAGCEQGTIKENGFQKEAGELLHVFPLNLRKHCNVVLSVIILVIFLVKGKWRHLGLRCPYYQRSWYNKCI